MTLKFDETASYGIRSIFEDKDMRFKGPDGKEYPSYRDVRRAELEQYYKIQTDEFGKRVEVFMTSEEIERWLDRELGTEPTEREL